MGSGRVPPSMGQKYLKMWAHPPAWVGLLTWDCAVLYVGLWQVGTQVLYVVAGGHTAFWGGPSMAVVHGRVAPWVRLISERCRSICFVMLLVSGWWMLHLASASCPWAPTQELRDASCGSRSRAAAGLVNCMTTTATSCACRPPAVEHCMWSRRLACPGSKPEQGGPIFQFTGMTQMPARSLLPSSPHQPCASPGSCALPRLLHPVRLCNVLACAGRRAELNSSLLRDHLGWAHAHASCGILDWPRNRDLWCMPPLRLAPHPSPRSSKNPAVHSILW